MEWISVNDKFPCPFVSVLGVIKDAAPFPAVRECYLAEGGFYFPALREMQEITHWAEMPEPPVKISYLNSAC